MQLQNSKAHQFWIHFDIINFKFSHESNTRRKIASDKQSYIIQ